MSNSSAQTPTADQPELIVHIDQMGRAVRAPANPRRIVSLVPSQTELLIDLGLADRLVGITRYCIHPQAVVKHIHKIGGTKRFDVQAIVSLQPDLIIGNKEENDKVGISELAEYCPVWMSDIENFAGAMEMISAIGAVTGTHEQTSRLCGEIETGWQTINVRSPRRAAYLIWRKPWMAVADNTFINDVLATLGFENAFAGAVRYPEFNLDDLRKAAPEIVMLSSEPFPFGDKHIAELQAALPQAQVVLVDGEMFSWYGSRLRLAPAYFESLLTQLDGKRQ